MGFTLDDLVSRLDLRASGPDTFQGDNYPLEYRRVFGGQLLAQGIRCLHATTPGKQVKSLTQHFPREGDKDAAIDYRVETAHEGRTFGTKTVTATQASAKGERTIGLLTASLHAPEPGRERSQCPPDVVPPGWAEATDMRIMPWDIRVVEGGSLTDPEVRKPIYRYWMRVADLGEHLTGDLAGVDPADPEQQWLHQALLAHASEPTIIGTALFPLEGLSQADAQVKFTSAVTTHQIWFHAPLRVDDWLLVDQHSPVMGGGRVFGRADVWSREGGLVASVAQESMVRLAQEA